MTSAPAGHAARSTRMRSSTRTRLILAIGCRGGKVTMVLVRFVGFARRIWSSADIRLAAPPEAARVPTPRAAETRHSSKPDWWLTWLACWLLSATICVPAAEMVPPCPQSTKDLYARIRSVGLDPQRVYSVRDAALDRANLHIDLDDGTLAFTEDLCGRITGAFFEGEGEIRLRPPNRVERGSLALFTGMAILEEQFTSAYFRFNDDTAALLERSLRPAPEAAEFIKKWDDSSRTLAEFDALRLLLDFSHFLPAPGGNKPDQKFPSFLHAHLLGQKLGSFEVFWDTAGGEPVWGGQGGLKGGVSFFDIWTSFPPAGGAAVTSVSLSNDVSITGFRIQAWVQPPTRLQASTEVKIHIRNGNERALLFELSRYLKIEAVEVSGRALDFIQNPAIEGTELRRKGNDLVTVVFPAPLVRGQELELHFTYAGDVLSEAGNGLLYVGERGTWYPNLGLSPAQFDMELHYPSNWTLVATGKQSLHATGDDGEKNADPPADRVAEK